MTQKEGPRRAPPSAGGRRVGSPTRAVGYVRVSTREQRLGPEAQRAALVDWCRLRGVALAARLGALARRQGAALVVVEGPPPGESPEAVLLEQLVDAVAQFEAAVCRARTRAALQAKLARGEAAGGVPPYGWRIRKGRLEVDEAARARELHDEGVSLRRLAARLRIEGHQPRGRSWHPSTLARLLLRAP